MAQTWNIKGITYTHEQLMEMRKQKLDPKKDDIVLKAITRSRSGELNSEPVEEVKPETVEEVKPEPVEEVK